MRARAQLDDQHGPDHPSPELQGLAEALALGGGALATWEATCGASMPTALAGIGA